MIFNIGGTANKEGQTKAWDHLQTIELEKLSIQLVSKVSEVEGMSSFDHFYTFYRTLKRWTTRIWPRQAPSKPQAGPMQAPCTSKRHMFGDYPFLRHLEAIRTGRRGGVGEG